MCVRCSDKSGDASIRMFTDIICRNARCIAKTAAMMSEIVMICTGCGMIDRDASGASLFLHHVLTISTPLELEV